MFKLQQQKHSWDCGIACLAMMTKKSYEHTFDILLPHGLISRCAMNDGFDDHQMLGIISVLFQTQCHIAYGFIESMPGILKVASIRNPGKNHYVFWTGSEILDPAGDDDLSHDLDTVRMSVTSHIFSPNITAD